MKRILFVDDEPNVLQGLQNLLRRYRKEWEMSFACGGEAALQDLSKSAFDVIVTDMRMPGMDGAELLSRVQQEHPKIVRIVLSGQTEQDAARRIVHVAHQFMAKPCDAPVLQEVINRACQLQAIMGDEELRRSIGKIGQLPALPAVYDSLTKALGNPKTSLKDVAMIVERDPAVSAKILQLVNSAFFGLPQRIVKIDSAVSYLGTEVIKNLALMIEVFGGASGNRPVAGFSLESLQAHALLTARIAKRIVGESLRPQDAYTAGMLHDIGQLIMATKMAESFERIIADAKQSGRPLHEAESEVCGVTHAKVGAYLLGLWGLPYQIVEAVAWHHAPDQIGATSFDIPGVVHVADVLAHEIEPAATGPSVLHAAIDMAYLEKQGVASRLEEWRAMAAQEAGAVGVS